MTQVGVSEANPNMYRHCSWGPVRSASVHPQSLHAEHNRKETGGVTATPNPSFESLFRIMKNGFTARARLLT